MRGLKTWLRQRQPAQLTGRGERRSFVELRNGTPSGRRLRGITKLLSRHLFSQGAWPHAATHGHDPGRWASTSGQGRGARVDSQLSRVVNTGASASSASYKLVRCVLEFLKTRGLQPVLCQRVVAMPARGVATAVDLLCFDAAEHALWVLELKTGYAGDRAMACRADGRQCHLAHPLSKAADTHLNRHILQAVLGREMLVLETGFAEQLMQKFGVSDVRAAVLYVNGATVDLVVPDAWWTRKASEALQRLADG